jgi:magnesium chelatase subunit D
VRPATYPFAAIVGQPEMKLALLLAAVDWRLGVLLRGDKGSGKTTTARALAALLPPPAPFINLPIGTTEDRLLGGLHLERTLKGDPVLKPGLLVEAHGGVLYVDEVNLLPAHLGDALLDTAAGGVHVVEREGLSATHPAQFVLLGSMNPEEGSLRPQLLDRFALSVTVVAPLDPNERQLVMERRIAFERDSLRFAGEWSTEQEALQLQVACARATLREILCSGDVMGYITRVICEHNVRSLRADLSAARAAIAYAALRGDTVVDVSHVDAVLPFILAHRTRESTRSSPPPPSPAIPPHPSRSESQAEAGAREAQDRVFAPSAVPAPAMEIDRKALAQPGRGASANMTDYGPVVGSRRTEFPAELDLRATLSHSLREAGSMEPRIADLHERLRRPRMGTRYLLLVDSSGSHAAQQRMRLVKGAVSALLARSFQRGDEVAMIVFRGTTAEVVLEPTEMLADAMAVLEYIPTGGRTPLTAALHRAQSYLTPTTLLILLTDGRANVPLHGGDPWQEALHTARHMSCTAVVVDTEAVAERLGQCAMLAETLGARYLSLGELTEIEHLSIETERIKPQTRGA